jgi:microcystin-dependent protein
MNRYITFLIGLLFLAGSIVKAQKTGIGTSNPTQILDVNGTAKSNALIINSGGTQYDFLVKNSAAGDIGFKKAFGAIAINYIICISGEFPSQAIPNLNPIIGEIKPFAGSIPPAGWAFCDGTFVPISQNTALFAILGTTYGGNGQVTFALPDLRGSVVVCTGINAVGCDWDNGEKHY